MKYIYDNKEVKLHGIFQESYVMSPSVGIGGHNGGTIARPIAVIELGDGTITYVEPRLLLFFKSLRVVGNIYKNSDLSEV